VKLRHAVPDVLAGAGQGLLAWTGLAIALLALRGGLVPSLEGVQLAGLAAGLLLSALAFAGPPASARREGAASLALGAPPALAAVALLLWMPPGASRAAWLACLGMLVAVLGLAAIARTAASRHRARAGRDPLPLVIQMLAALLCGLALQALAMAAMLPGEGMAAMLPMLMLFGLVLAVLMGLQGRVAHAAPPRLLASAGLLTVPALLASLSLAAGWVGVGVATLAAALGTLAGTLAWRTRPMHPAAPAPAVDAVAEQPAPPALDR